MTSALFRVTASYQQLSADDRAVLFDRSTSTDTNVRRDTATIIADVLARGDVALREFASKFDGASLDTFEIPRAQWQNALNTLPHDLRSAMERSARNIASVHGAFLPETKETEPEPGIRIGRRADPLQRIGVYAPGGRAAYPSSVLMGAVPARVAGVKEVIVCSPPDSSGMPSSVVLAAAELANADRVFALGGAGAIAAMAYGTASVPRVDRIVGPGNAYVAEAKLQVSGAVAIDSPAGPSELLVIADESADPRVVAREVLAQAEHDPRAAVVIVAVGETLADRIRQTITQLIPKQERAQIITESLATRGGLVTVSSVDEAVAFNTEFAPEHLLLLVADASAVATRCFNAGTIFIGTFSSVAFGDYMTGANHVLPTGGLARSYSGLSVLDFMRWTTYQTVSRDAAASLASDVGSFADSEGLPAHAATARQWSNS